ncbi:MAG: hypothetical protein CL910_15395 [Deltaproteobacteria bacterium]|jgi:flagellar basal-body rod modification protein FlgD|nr:hypothetical protein [Deltaproteobacteria bacterium]
MISTDVITANSSSAITGSSDASGELGRQDFLTMLIAQLENQDPLNPQEGTEFTAQLAQFSSLEQLLGMRESIDALAAVQSQAQTLGAAGLIGKKVLVRGNEFEIDANAAELPKLSFELSEPAQIQSIELIGENGATAAMISDVGLKPSGITEIDWNEFDVTPGPGLYRLRLNQLTDDVAPQALVESRVTGTAIQDGILYLGRAQANLADVREVRE